MLLDTCNFISEFFHPSFTLGNFASLWSIWLRQYQVTSERDGRKGGCREMVDSPELTLRHP